MVTRPDAELLKLPVDERLALVDSLWESIRANAEDVSVSAEAIAETGRRLELHRADPGSADDLDAVMARLRAKY